MAHDVNQGEKDVAARVRSALVDKISSERFDLWIPTHTQWEWDGQHLTLRFSNEFAAQLAKKMLRVEIQQALATVVGPEASSELHFATMSLAGVEAEDLDSSSDKENSRTSPRKAADGKAVPSTIDGTLATGESVQSDEASETRQAPPVKASTVQDASGRVPSDRWNHFVSGDSNRLLWTAAKLITDEPGRLSPAFIHGPHGSGKSLAASAITHQLRTFNRLRRVAHMTSEQFTNDFTEGLRGGGLPMFRRKYRDVDVLVVEDIQFFFGKRASLAELRHTIDELARRDRQVVLTSDRGLNELTALGEELIGILRGGLIVPVFPLDQSVRAELLNQMLEAANLSVDSEVCSELSSRISGDGRVVSGIVKRLVAHAAIHKTGPETLGWESCWSAVADLVQGTQPIVRLRDIERAVCDMFGLDAESLQSKSKKRSVSQPRMLAMFLARKYTPAAYKEIGQHFGQRRHSTVISAEKQSNIGSVVQNGSNWDAGTPCRMRSGLSNQSFKLVDYLRRSRGSQCHVAFLPRSDEATCPVLGRLSLHETCCLELRSMVNPLVPIGR